MSKIVLLVASLILSANAAASTIALQNPGFEEPMTGKRIPGWARTQHAGVRAYEISTDKKSHAEGKASIRMLRTTEQAYGMIAQQVETPELAGKTVKLIAALKGEGVGKNGWVMVLTFYNHGNILDQVRATPVTGDMAWKDVTIEKIAPLGTSKIEVGFLLLDGGTVWADNVRLRAVDGDMPGLEAPESQSTESSEPTTGKSEAAKLATENARDLTPPREND